LVGPLFSISYASHPGGGEAPALVFSRRAELEFQFGNNLQDANQQGVSRMHADVAIFRRKSNFAARLSTARMDDPETRVPVDAAGVRRKDPERLKTVFIFGISVAGRTGLGPDMDQDAIRGPGANRFGVAVGDRSIHSVFHVAANLVGGHP